MVSTCDCTDNVVTGQVGKSRLVPHQTLQEGHEAFGPIALTTSVHGQIQMKARVLGFVQLQVLREECKGVEVIAHGADLRLPLAQVVEADS